MARTARNATAGAPVPRDLHGICCALALLVHGPGARAAAEVAAQVAALRQPFICAMQAKRLHNLTGDKGAEEFDRMFSALLRRPELIPYVNDWRAMLPG